MDAIQWQYHDAGGNLMNRYNISAALAPLEKKMDGDVLVLLTSEELERGVSIPGLERVLCHTCMQSGSPAQLPVRNDCDPQAHTGRRSHRVRLSSDSRMGGTVR